MAKRSFDLSAKNDKANAIQGSQSPRAINRNLSQKCWEGFYFLPLSPVPWSKVAKLKCLWAQLFCYIPALNRGDVGVYREKAKPTFLNTKMNCIQ